MVTFEESIPKINKVISLYRSRWTLQHYSYEDISQDILLHIYHKWHLYNQEKNLEPWIARLTQNFLKNEMRNKYYIHQKPCLRCPMYTQDDGCKLYGTVSSKCRLYKKFIEQKSEASNINFPVSYETSSYDSSQPFSCTPTEFTQGLNLIISGIDKEVFNLFFASGFSTTKIARHIHISGQNFNERFEIVEESLKNTQLLARDVIEDKKISMGLNYV